MIISYQHNFIFLKTRKTGSSSIQMALSAVCSGDDLVVGDEKNLHGNGIGLNIERAFARNAHAPLKQIRWAVGERQWSQSFKLAFVRNPWDLVVSRYHWEKKGRHCSVADFRSWLPIYTDASASQPQRNDQGNIVQPLWETGGGFSKDLQAPYVFDGDQLALQFVGRFERLHEDFARVCQHLDIEAAPLPHLKAGYRKVHAYRDAYDAASKQRVAEVFAEDIARFEYRY